jgi:hypothetical protein
MALAVEEQFVATLPPDLRPVAAGVARAVSAAQTFDVGIRWKQLTFALDGDFDHWVCAVAAGTKRVHLSFHFGSMLADSTGVFAPSDAKFVRRIGYASVEDIDGLVIADLVGQAVGILPAFRARR